MRVIPDELVEKTPALANTWTQHRMALSCVNDGECLDQMPTFIKRIIAGELWKNIWLQPNGRVCEFKSFAEYVQQRQPDGLGASIDSIKRLCRDDIEALNAIDAVTQRGDGGNNNPDGLGGHTGKTRGDLVTFDNVQGDKPASASEQSPVVKAPTGNSRETALRRLRKDRPDLLERVLASELSPHAAMIEAGFRKKKSPEEQVMYWFERCEDKEAVLQELQEMMSATHCR